MESSLKSPQQKVVTTKQNTQTHTFFFPNKYLIGVWTSHLLLDWCSLNVHLWESILTSEHFSATTSDNDLYGKDKVILVLSSSRSENCFACFRENNTTFKFFQKQVIFASNKFFPQAKNDLPLFAEKRKKTYIVSIVSSKREKRLKNASVAFSRPP